jgi:hypothetical protein
MAFQTIETVGGNGFREAEDFTAVISCIELTIKDINETPSDMVVMEFGEDEAPIEWFAPEDWGHVEEWKGFGRIIKDLKKSGIQVGVDIEAMKIQTVPSIVGATIAFKCTVTEKMVKGNQKRYVNWNISSIQLPDVSGSTAPGKAAAPAADAAETMATCRKSLETILTGHARNLREIKNDFANLEPDRDKRLPQIRVLDNVISDMIDEGSIVLNEGVYSLI